MTSTRTYEQIKKDVLQEITPSKKEYLLTKKIIDELLLELKRLFPEQKILLGGSTAKDTWLTKNHDIDFFILFKQMPKDPLKKLETMGAKRVKGSRDYYQLSYKGFNIEMVPVIEVTKYTQANNVTDMSVLHVDHIKKYMLPEQKKEVRLAKQFAKAQKVYGAESYINGFSGHVLELLIIEYKTFLGLLKAAANWPEQVILDPKKHHKNPGMILNKEKTRSPLIIIDPVQPDRNAAAALSKKSFDMFCLAAKKFIQKPTISVFRKKPLTISRIKKLSGNKIIVELFALEEKRDTAGTKSLKAFEYICNHLDSFTITKKGFEYNHTRASALTYIIVKEKKLASKYLHKGPPLNVTKAVAEFKKKHKKTFEQDKRICTELTRKHTTLHSQVNELLTHKPVTTRTTKTKIIS